MMLDKLCYNWDVATDLRGNDYYVSKIVMLRFKGFCKLNLILLTLTILFPPPFLVVVSLHLQ